jgi:hypothetical protein
LKLSRTFTRRWSAIHWLVVAACLVLLVGGVGLVIAAPWDEEGGPTKTDEFFGVSPQATMETSDFDRLSEAGAGTVRILFDWGSIQQKSGDCQSDLPTGVCNWNAMDELVGDAASHDVRVMAVMGGIRGFRHPGETAVSETPEGHPPISGEGFEAWKDFLAAAAERYGPGGAFWRTIEEFSGGEELPIRTWQIWNEQNADRYWPPEPDAGEYATLVTGSSEAIRGADPDAEIVLGGMFGTAAVKSTTFLEDLYAVEGIEDAFDAVAIHPYSPTVKGIEVQAEWLRRAATEAGDPGVGLWVTELGWGSAEDGHPLELGEDGQAELLEGSFELLSEQRDEWNVRGVVWFTWRDRDDEEVCEFCRNAGLLDVEGEPKPAWDSFVEAVGG